MHVENQIRDYLAGQPGSKRKDLEDLHLIILKLLPGARLWFLDGKNSENKTVSNPNIGYGLHTLNYADGSSREFYKVGLSANSTGISVYLMGIHDKAYLANTFGKKIGKASITGYCIKFRSLKDIHLETLSSAISFCAGEDYA